MPDKEASNPATSVVLPTLLTVDETAAFLRVNRKTLYEAIRLKQVPGVVHVGRVIRINREALVNWTLGNSGPAHGGSR